VLSARPSKPTSRKRWPSDSCKTRARIRHPGSCRRQHVPCRSALGAAPRLRRGPLRRQARPSAAGPNRSCSARTSPWISSASPVERPEVLDIQRGAPAVLLEAVQAEFQQLQLLQYGVELVRPRGRGHLGAAPRTRGVRASWVDRWFTDILPVNAATFCRPGVAPRARGRGLHFLPAYTETRRNANPPQIWP